MVFLALAAGFLPAALVSLRSTPVRRAVLTGETVWCLVLAFAGSIVLGLGFALLLVVPTALLAIGAGLVFQPRPRS